MRARPDGAFAEAEAEPPAVETTLQGFFIAALAQRGRSPATCGRVNQRMKIEAMLDESQRTGKVIKNLAEDDREIRRAHAEEVLRLPLHRLDQQPAAVTGTLHGSGAVKRLHPNRLIASPVIPNNAPPSATWQAAQQRMKTRTQASDSRPALRHAA